MTPESTLAPGTISAVSAMPMQANSVTQAPMVSPPFSAFPSPICCPSSIVAPMAKLETRLVSVIMICDPVETAETSAALPNRPTTSRSTAPYIACRNSAASTGSANRTSGDSILPSVKFWVRLSLSIRVPPHGGRTTRRFAFAPWASG